MGQCDYRPHDRGAPKGDNLLMAVTRDRSDPTWHTLQPVIPTPEHASFEQRLTNWFFEGDLAWAGFRTDGLEFLARRYQASLEATAIHAADHWPRPAMCLVAKKPLTVAARRSKTADALLTVTYTRRQGAWPDAPTAHAVLQSGALHQALSERSIEGTLILDHPSGEQPGRAQISAKAYPYGIGAEKRNRVIAMLTPA